MLHVSKTWSPTPPDLHILQRSDQAMIRWMKGQSLLGNASGDDAARRPREGTSHPSTGMTFVLWVG